MAAPWAPSASPHGCRMRTLNECFNRPQTLAVTQFQEEGRGLGFSIGGWHPFRANTYLPTLKKLDPLANTALGKAVWKPIEKVNQSVNKDFAKAKKWSQAHRKQLQIAAALAAAAVGGMYALGYLGTSGAAAGAAGTAATEAAAAEALGAAAATGAATEGVVATTAIATETLAPIAASSAATSAAASGLSLVPATVGATEGVVATTAIASEALAPIAASSGGSALSLVPATVPTATAAGSTFVPLTAAAAPTGSGILGAVGSTVGSVAKSLGPLLALSKMIGGAPQPQQESGGYDAYGPISYGNSGGGGGGFLGPMAPMGPEAPAAPAASSIPSWVVPAAAVGLLVFLIKE